MIIFDLDTLADCEHRRHFVDPLKNENYFRYNGNDFRGWKDGKPALDIKWKPDWKSFYEACDKDILIESVGRVYEHIAYSAFSSNVEIWSGICESQREKTLDWVISNLYWSGANREYLSSKLKMRPIGDNTPYHELKERWLDEYMFGEECKHKTLKGAVPLNKIDFVFESDPESIKMWRKRGVFVFDTNQVIV